LTRDISTASSISIASSPPVATHTGNSAACANRKPPSGWRTNASRHNTSAGISAMASSRNNAASNTATCIASARAQPPRASQSNANHIANTENAQQPCSRRISPRKPLNAGIASTISISP